MKRNFLSVAFTLCALFILNVAVSCTGTTPASADSIQRVTPESVGMDSKRLSKVDDIINASIENKEIPGAVLAVVKDGKDAHTNFKVLIPITSPCKLNNGPPLLPGLIGASCCTYTISLSPYTLLYLEIIPNVTEP